MNQPKLIQAVEKMASYNPSHYTYRVEWSPDDGEFVATVLEFPSLSWLDADQLEALAGLVRVVAGVVDDLTNNGDIEKVPAPFGERAFSGKFLVRTTADVHRKLAIEAAERHTSLNNVAVARLSAV